MCLGIMTVPIINKVILGWVAFGAGFCPEIEEVIFLETGGTERVSKKVLEISST